MSLETYFAASAGATDPTRRMSQPGEDGIEVLDDLIHLKSRILSRKLDILASEMMWRLNISSRKFASLADDKSRLEDMIGRLDRAASYHLRDHKEKGSLYQQLFKAESEKRAESAECWRDIAMVMRDFLIVWEEHEQTRARAMFLKNVGTGTPGYL